MITSRLFGGTVVTAMVCPGLIVVEEDARLNHSVVFGENHVPSAPGEPPNYDSGVLSNNIETTQTGPLRVEVSSNAPYSAALEYGTSRMAERPYMRPAVAKRRKEVTHLVRQAVSSVVRSSKGA